MARGAAKSLKRRAAKRDPKHKFHIFTEGRNTEPDYLNALRKAFPSALIEIKITGGVGAPITIANKAAACAKEEGISPRVRRKQSSFETSDQVWAVFDRDEHARFDEAIAVCNHDGVCVARSNPCFEVWLILHHEDYNRLDDSRAVQTHLAAIDPHYDAHRGKRPNCDDIVCHVSDAEERAEKQLQSRVREGAAFGRPSTTVGKLTSTIRAAAHKASGK